MESRSPQVKRSRSARRRRRLRQGILVGLAVAAAISLVQWAGLFASAQVRASDYLYETTGDPGNSIVIVAIDEKSLQALGDWPWSLDNYVQLFGRLHGAGAVGFDVLLPDPGPAGNPDTPALLEATHQAGNIVLPLTALEMIAPQSPGELYRAGGTVTPFPELLDAAAGAGAVAVASDGDGTLRRLPLLVDAGEGDIWEAFTLRILRLYLGLGSDPATLVDDRVVIGNEIVIDYEIQTDANAMTLVNFVGQPNTFPSYSFIDVIEDRVSLDTFEGRIVLVGMMNAASEMDLHLTPVSSARMAGIEFHANAIHTLLNHRALAPQRRSGTTVTIIVLALVLSVMLSLLQAIPGTIFTALLAAGYFIFTGLQFDAGHLTNVMFPYATIFVTYAAAMTVRFASAWGERRRVTDAFGRFVAPDVRDEIMDLALQDPDLIRPGGRQIEVSILFADIRGFTTMAESMSPQDVVEVLNQYLDSMAEEVFSFGGTLDKYTGDGMMVIFGAPLEQPDHAERAVRAAVGMQHAAIEISRHSEAKGKLAYGIGIATGPAVVGHVGSARRLDYTAIGDTVNLAARLEGKASPETILVSSATYEMVKEVVVAKELPPMTVKGKAEPVIVYQVQGLRE